MNNFHYRNPFPQAKTQKGAKLMEQLQMINKQIDADKKKLAQKRKLQEQFYEDSNKMNLADEIMNQLLNQKMPSKNSNEYQSPKQQEINLVNNNRSNPKDDDFRDQRINFNTPLPTLQQQKRNQQFVNPREIQKQKLQNKNAQQQFAIGSNSRQKDQRKNIEHQNARKYAPQRQPPMRDNFVVNQPLTKKKSQKQFVQIQNPFLKNQQYLKDKRQQQQKNYRRLLEEQMEEQKRRKDQEKQKFKQENKQKFNSYNPLVHSPTNEQKQAFDIQVKKKRDPNAQYVSLQKPLSQIRPSDIEFMKMQVDDFRNKLKKGRINHQQYDMHIKKLETHYKCKIDQIFGSLNNQIKQNNEKAVNQQIEKQKKPETIGNNPSDMGRNISGFQEIERKENDQLDMNKQWPQKQVSNNYYNNTSVPIEQMGPRFPIHNNYSHAYQPQGIVPPQIPQSDMQMQMMLKLFQELKGIIKMQSQNQMSIINDKRVLQQTISKLNPFMYPNSNNPIMYTQQVPASQLPPPTREFHSDVKKIQKIQNFPKNNVHGVDYSYPQSGDSQISSSYIQKSLSGIVNKIPLTKKQKQEEKVDPGKEIARFYDRKYKIKKFKGFQYKQVDNQSSFVIPSVSNFLQTKNSQNQLSQAFEKDLRNYKKLEKQRDIFTMKQKIKRDKQNPYPKNQNAKKSNSNKQQYNIQQPKINKYQSLNINYEQKPNPFLKKHISNQQNQIIPVKKNDEFRQISSPVPKSSQILQQFEYQTEPRKSESPVNNPNQKLRMKKNQAQAVEYKKMSPQQMKQINAQKNKEYPSSRLMNIVKTNNEILSKYEQTPSRIDNSNIQSNSLSSIKQIVRAEQSKDLSSRQYFSGHDISPVQRREYESSLETVRSEEESARFQRKNNMDMLMRGSSQHHSHSSAVSGYYSPMPPPQSIHESPTIQSIQVGKKQYVVGSNRYQSEEPNITGYSQTVQSIEQSSSKLPSFQKPPSVNARKNPRSASRKKQSVIKTGNSDNFQKSGLSGIPSEGSKEKSSSLLKPPSYEQDNPSNLESPRFDSAIYQSAYEQSVDSRENPSKVKITAYERVQHTKSIPNTFKQVLNQGVSDRISSPQKQKIKIIHKEQQLVNESQAKGNTSVSSRWKSLEQARKLAKQFRQRSGEEHNRSSVEQKLSQLESYLHTNKKQQSVVQTKSRKQETGTTNKKKDIMKILDHLGQQDYEPDFESYKQESER